MNHDKDYPLEEMQQKHRTYSSFLQIQDKFKTWQIIVISLVIMAALIFIVYLGNVPNPNMILIAGLVVTSSLFGYYGGIPSAIIMLGYTLFFFSSDNDFITFTDENFSKVIVSVIGIVVDMFFVCALKRRELSAVREINSLTTRLQEDNMLLQEMSLTDALTGLGNRLALRHDYNSYQNQKIRVMMMDVDDFKMINDRFGHSAGDEMLKMTGKILKDSFPDSHCYRFGGDEFLVISPYEAPEEYRARLDRLMNCKHDISEKNDKIMSSYSVGYACGQVNTEGDLRDMFDLADKRLYESKARGKNQITGDDRPEAGL